MLFGLGNHKRCRRLDRTRLFARGLLKKTGKTSEGTEMGLLLRWLIAFLLLAATYNPTDYNYVVWARANYVEELPLTVLLGLLLLIGYVIYLRATLRSIGAFGMTVVLAVLAAIAWVLHDYDMLSLDNGAVNIWLAILALSIVLGIGLGWSIVRRMLTGQVAVDDVEA